MTLDNWKVITPYTVAKKMCFDVSQDDWRYDAQDPSMAARQAEGVAGLWNILAKRSLALLADEVGMGKTYQAIGVILHLWQIKPDAKILIMVPNRDICLHWIREYKIFLLRHYRGKNANICNADKDPVHEARMFTRLNELEKDICESPGNLYLTTIHALSGLVPLHEKDNSLVNAESAERYAAQLHTNIKASLGEQGFDLIVIDEAHYFRNRDGQSQRAAAAKSFFGKDDERLGQRTLLLSATPNHSSSRNVADIFSYFIHPESVSPDGDVKTLLKTFAVRRLRKMQGQGITNNKYNYRNERVTAASFVNNPDAELFFALYQKELVNALGEKGENRQFQYGYLEGFESTGIVAREDNDTEVENADEMAKDAFHRAPDSDLLTTLTKEFQHIYHRFPDHPKYDSLVKQCIPEKLFDSRASLYSYKHLVFVRRIPSVREITQRINAEYDEVMAKEILSAWGVELPEKTLKAWRKSGWSRKHFNRLTQVLAARIQQDDIVDKLESDENDDRQLNELKLSSKIADLFVAKTSGIKRTDCTNVSQRFRRPENLFSLFLEPAADYFTAEYHTYYRVAEQQRDSFSDAARDYRRSQWIEQQTPLNSANTSERQYNQPLKTVWGMMFPLLPEHCQQQIKKWHHTNPAIVENLGNYLKAGYVFASPVMIELYCWYTRFSRNNNLQDVQERYRHFTDRVADKLPGSLLLRYFINGIETFEAMCEKITDHKLDDCTMPWRELTSLSSPAWYASGETDNRQRLILGFNSPFYPNILVATSVFQEGVNLHLQCNQVHHYGIAWTPGDNEQRVGRIDRLFGRVNHLLKEQGSTELGIHYPYLIQSLDQDQLAAFILHKRNFEAKLDACDFEQFSRDINLKDDVGGWEDALRKPQVDLKPVDPYPVSLGTKRASSKDHNRG